MIKKLIPVLLAAAVFCFRAEVSNAQQTRTEVVKATTPEEDARPNSGLVPDVIPIEGEFDHIVVLRFKFKTDLLQGLQKELKELGIRNGVILADSDGAFGGHLEEGTHVFTFAIVAVGVFKDGIDLSKVDDKTYR
jgi:hypothetical protein